MYEEFASRVLGLRLDFFDARMIVEACAGVPSSVTQPRDVSRGIQAGAGFVHHAAEINVRADFGAQVTLGNDALAVMEFTLDENG